MTPPDLEELFAGARLRTSTAEDQLIRSSAESLLEGHRKRRRRLRWLIVLALAGAAVAAQLIVRRTDAPARLPEATALPAERAAPLDPEVQWALDLMRGPRSGLLRQHPLFLAIVEMHPQHVELWHGVEVLAQESLRNGEDELDLARSVHITLSMSITPTWLRPLRDRVAQRIARAQRGR